MTEMDRLAEIKRRAFAATCGPWWIAGSQPGEYQLSNPVIRARSDATSRITVARTGSNNHKPQEFLDADFIAASREDIPWLIAELERVSEELKARIRALESDCRIKDQRIEFDEAELRGTDMEIKIAKEMIAERDAKLTKSGRPIMRRARTE